MHWAFPCSNRGAEARRVRRRTKEMRLETERPVVVRAPAGRRDRRTESSANVFGHGRRWTSQCADAPRRWHPEPRHSDKRLSAQKPTRMYFRAVPVSGASYLPAEPPRCRWTAEAVFIRRFNTEGRQTHPAVAARHGPGAWAGPGHAVLRAAAPRQIRAAPCRRPERRRCRRTALHVRQRRARPGCTEDVHSAMQVIVRVASRARASGDGFLYEAWPAIASARALQGVVLGRRNSSRWWCSSTRSTP